MEFKNPDGYQMKIILTLAYILVLLSLAVIAFIPLGIGVWSNQQPIGYAYDIPILIRILSLIFLILLLAGGLYFLWQNYFRSA